MVYAYLLDRRVKFVDQCGALRVHAAVVNTKSLSIQLLQIRILKGI
jgi:hypothetical protein